MRNWWKHNGKDTKRIRNTKCYLGPSLDLETSRLSATTGSFELASLGTNIGLGMVVRTWKRVKRISMKFTLISNRHAHRHISYPSTPCIAQRYLAKLCIFFIFSQGNSHSCTKYSPILKCLTASRAFFGPRSKMVLLPFGARRANWSNVRHSPPAAKILARAVLVNRRAATDNLGSSRTRLSSVMDPTMTIVFGASLPLDTPPRFRER